jgi:hypothetical protein
MSEANQPGIIASLSNAASAAYNSVSDQIKSVSDSQKEAVKNDAQEKAKLLELAKNEEETAKESLRNLVNQGEDPNSGAYKTAEEAVKKATDNRVAAESEATDADLEALKTTPGGKRKSKKRSSKKKHSSKKNRSIKKKGGKKKSVRAPTPIRALPMDPSPIAMGGKKKSVRAPTPIRAPPMEPAPVAP